MITLDMMPPLMFGGLILFMLVGYPVAFSLAALGIAFGLVAIDHGFFTLAYLQALRALDAAGLQATLPG